MSSQLQHETHWREQEIRDSENAFIERWDQLLITLQREIETLSVTIIALQQELGTTEPGSHLLDFQEKIQKFQLQECQVLTWDTNIVCNEILSAE